MSLVVDLAIAIPGLDVACRIEVERGETLALVGPNGAGKSTILRAIAGLRPIDSGAISVDGAVWDDPATDRFVPPRDRRVGMVFQDYALFAGLSALDNVAFGLRARGARRSDADAEARRMLAALDVVEIAERRPGELSGGQAQRVAIARALVGAPDVVLLDEPLAALDASTRSAVRRRLPEWLERGGGAAPPCRIVVTHDPVDADAVADRVVVVEAGRVVQRGTVFELAAAPRSAYVAELMGTNLLHGRLRGHAFVAEGGAELTVGAHRAADGEAVAAVRPAAVALHRHRPEGSPRNVWSTLIVSVDRSPDRLRVCLDAPLPLVVETTEAGFAALDAQPGDMVWASVKASEIAVIADG